MRFALTRTSILKNATHKKSVMEVCSSTTDVGGAQVRYKNSVPPRFLC